MSLRLGVDVGGTFTDVLLVSEESGDLTIAKVLSTPDDQSVGVMAGVAQACEAHGVGLDALSLILHGSTVVTNMILEEKGAVGGLLTTAGHEQILHLARAWTPGPLYAWMGMIKPDPLVPLWLTRGVPERTSASGEVVTGIDEEATRAAIEDLLASGTESLTIAFLNAYVNSSPRAAGAGDRARAAAGPARVDLLGPRLGVSRVRADADGGAELLHTAAGHQVRRRPGVAARRRRVPRPAEHRALRRRHDERALHEGAPGRHRVLRPVRRRGGRGVPRAPHGRAERPHVRHGRDLDRRRAVPRRRGRDQARGAARLLPVPGTRGRHPQRRRRRRLDRLPQSRRRAEGRPAQRGRRSRARLLRTRRHGADRHRRQRRARPAAGRVQARRAPRARRRRGRAGRGDGRRGARASTPSPPRRRSSTSPTRTCTRRCASCPWSAATTRATSGSSPSAARARCTPTRSRGSSAPTRSSSPARPACCPRSASWPREIQNEFARTYLRPAEETPGEDVAAAVDELIAEAAEWLTAEGVDAARAGLRRLRRLPLLPPGHPDPGGA